MNITFRGKKVNGNRLLPEGTYKGKIVSVKEADPAKIGSDIFKTIAFQVKISHNGSCQTKEKKVVLSNKPSSELMGILSEFEYLAENGEIDVLRLVNKPCIIEIEHSTSKKGNIFANISKIMNALEGEI